MKGKRDTNVIHSGIRNDSLSIKEDIIDKFSSSFSGLMFMNFVYSFNGLTLYVESNIETGICLK